MKKQTPPSAFDPVLVVSDKGKGLIDLMGRPLKDKGKKINENSDTRSERKKRHKDETQEKRNLIKALKRPNKDKEKRRERRKSLIK